MDQQLLDRLAKCRDLPSLPAAAVRIIELAEDPAATMGDVADAVGLDPALSAKVLRVANSALYSGRRQSANLRQAVMLLGLNGTLTIALSFSLFTSLRQSEHSRLNMDYFWRRSLLAGAAGRVVANETVNTSSEDAFLAALIQDIGILALDAATPDFYAELDSYQRRDHDYVARYENERLGSDHSEVGLWLLNRWQFPRHLTDAVGCSHDPAQLADAQLGQPVSRCVALSGLIADSFLRDDGEALLSDALSFAKRYWAVGDDWIDAVRDNLAAEVPVVESLFEMKILDETDERALQGEAREALITRNLHSMKRLEELHETTDSIRRRAVALEERSRKDDLTGLANRTHLDATIANEFQEAEKHRWPLTLIFIDLDHFKQINDSYGHHTGDDALRLVAATLSGSIRGNDTVGRYGGEEFVVVSPGTDSVSGAILGNRLLEAIRDAKLTADTGEPINLTISAGIATWDDRSSLSSGEALIRAADHAMYLAKEKGRDGLMLHIDD